MAVQFPFPVSSQHEGRVGHAARFRCRDVEFEYQFGAVIDAPIHDQYMMAFGADQRLAFQSIFRGEAHQALPQSDVLRGPEPAAIRSMGRQSSTHEVQISSSRGPPAQIDQTEDCAHVGE